MEKEMYKVSIDTQQQYNSDKKRKNYFSTIISVIDWKVLYDEFCEKNNITDFSHFPIAIKEGKENSNSITVGKPNEGQITTIIKIVILRYFFNLKNYDIILYLSNDNHWKDILNIKSDTTLLFQKQLNYIDGYESIIKIIYSLLWSNLIKSDGVIICGQLTLPQYYKLPIHLIDKFKLLTKNEFVYVFSPRHDIFFLPADATILDFAFEVHTDLGLHCTVGYVNDKYVNIESKITYGSVIEIISSDSQNPSEEWLKTVKTKKAYKAISKYLRNSNKKNNENQFRTSFDYQDNKLISHISLPEELQLAFQQYLLFFPEYAKKAKNVYMPMNIKRSSDGLTIEIEINNDISIELYNEYFIEYLNFAKNKIFTSAIIVGNPSKNEIELLKLQIEQQVSNFNIQLRFSNLQIQMLEQEKNNYLSLLQMSLSSDVNLNFNAHKQDFKQSQFNEHIVK